MAATASTQPPALATETGHIEIDPSIEDRDSAYGDDEASFTTSLTSSVTAYKFEHGRRFHAYKEGTYRFPNDEAEQDRLDMFHEICKLLAGDTLALAPFKRDGSILDLGTGTGIWAIEAGDTWPDAQVLGNDLSPIQPRWTPPNVKFEVDDIEADWAFSAPFDFVHSRYMIASIANWPRYVQQAFQFTKPGGWAEFQDYDVLPLSDDGSLKEGNQVLKLQRLAADACEKMGRTARVGPKLRGLMEEAGYTNITEKVYKLPIGMWPQDKRLKQIGALMMVNYMEALEAMTFAMFTSVLGWSIEEVQVFLVGVRDDLRKKDVHAYFHYYFVYGQKPE
ncbi:S-adenosyl-L-methionine-dependent methyltransferase [Macrophomina phaseolina]|uniref:S-adenosyl-L-methionine-dependent methyltransferase n=1 Tax=Macrophomina phaseolina TaxID=35725 RepID=A0ABQ8GNF1_9PEZI|nr:S-adenosyl-L-methionine-dependent methyltransferase [Macrophomina phaseolina]